MKNKKHFYSTQEIADLLGVSASSIQRWADSGKLKCTRTNDEIRQFNAEDLLDFAKQYNIAMNFLDEHRTMIVAQNEKHRPAVVVSQ